MAESGGKTTNISSEEFKLRIQIETMILTWVRTALSLMAFGFVTARFGLFLRQIASVGELAIRN